MYMDIKIWKHFHCFKMIGETGNEARSVGGLKPGTGSFPQDES
jgi:hypothetical protein